MTSDKNRNRAVFLDRDGTINEEVEYLHRVEDFRFISGVPEAIALLKQAGYLVIVVTNQSGVARGYYDETAVQRLHRYLDQKLAEFGTAVDGYYLCPHHPEHGLGALRVDCQCRKPLPGMLLQAAEDFSIDLSSSFMVGDKLADLEAGRRAGCRSLLVLSGYGRVEAKALADQSMVFPDLLAAARLIVESSGSSPAAN